MLKLFPAAALRLATFDLHFETSVPALGSRSFFPSKISVQDPFALMLLALSGFYSLREENVLISHYVHHSTSTMCVSDKYEFQREQAHCHLPRLLFNLASLLSPTPYSYPRLSHISKAFSSIQDLLRGFLLTSSLLQSLLQKAFLFLKLIPQQSSPNQRPALREVRKEDPVLTQKPCQKTG